MDGTASVETGATAQTPVARVFRSRTIIAAVVLGALAATAAWQWSWLAAIGVAPLLLAIAPCAAMCGLGLCMHRMSDGSRAAVAPQSPSMESSPAQSKIEEA
jgi:hypothetical protein